MSLNQRTYYTSPLLNNNNNNNNNNKTNRYSYETNHMHYTM
ncbi:MAG: hypothetical protein K7J15_03290 [Candidatus Regiella insecticola]|nr:hypothetical protein [Candidatus Regiella insecticola]